MQYKNIRSDSIIHDHDDDDGTDTGKQNISFRLVSLIPTKDLRIERTIKQRRHRQSCL